MEDDVEKEEGFVEGDAEFFFGGEGEEDVGGPGGDAGPDYGVAVVLDEGYKFRLIVVRIPQNTWVEDVKYIPRWCTKPSKSQRNGKFLPPCKVFQPPGGRC